VYSPLVHLAVKTLQRFDVLEYLGVDESIMISWLQLIESNYHADNPYHNSTHAADVMHATAFFLSCDKLKVSTFAALELFCHHSSLDLHLLLILRIVRRAS